MHQENIIYQAGDINAKGFISYPDKSKPYPAVLVVHDWTGRNQFACDKATLLTEMGYVGFAIDMYGEAKCGHSNEEKSQMIAPMFENRKLLLQRLMAAYETLSSLPYVDKHRIAVMGYCFGGLCALDLARAGTDLKAAVSFHGIFKAPPMPNKPIKAKILALHGHDDPMVPPSQVADFTHEMTKAKADWQLHIYGNTMHAFTNPLANDPGFGTVYNIKSADRAWKAMQSFFEEIL